MVKILTPKQASLALKRRSKAEMKRHMKSINVFLSTFTNFPFQYFFGKKLTTDEMTTIITACEKAGWKTEYKPGAKDSWAIGGDSILLSL